MTIDGKTEKSAKQGKKQRHQFAACPSCGGTRFIEEQYPAYLQWKCRISLDGYATDYSRRPDIDGDPEVLSYTCAGCRAEYDTADDIVRNSGEADEDD